MLRKNVYSKKKNNYFLILVLLLICIGTIAIYIDSQIRPIIQNMSRYRVQSMITKLANETIIDEMINNNIQYDDLVTINQDSFGNITLLSYNTMQVNKLKYKLTQALSKNLSDLPRADIYVPILNITGIEILQNRGPRLKFTIYPVAYLETEMDSIFENNGINQVGHKIFINIKINATAFVPNYSSNINFETKVCVAQTIIIGKVPNNISDNFLRFSD